MVRLTRIYTRTGDDGTTGLGDGSRVPKTSVRIEAYGTVDELNALLGLCHEQLTTPARQAAVRQIQNDLFDLGADLCVPEGARPGGKAPLRIGPQRVLRLERWIDETNAALAPLQSFVLPGGGAANTTLHLARTVCRRAERRVQALAESEPVNVQCGIYLNRLSDLLFVMARAAVVGSEVLWSPCRDDAPSSPA